MLPVYICEDDEKIRAAQKEYLEKQILMEGYDMEIVLWGSRWMASGWGRRSGNWIPEVF